MVHPCTVIPVIVILLAIWVGTVDFQSQNPAKPSLLLHETSFLIGSTDVPLVKMNADCSGIHDGAPRASSRCIPTTAAPDMDAEEAVDTVDTGHLHAAGGAMERKKATDVCRHRKTYASTIISNTYAILYSLIEHQKKSQCLPQTALLLFFSTGFLRISSTCEHVYVSCHIILYQNIISYYTILCGVVSYCIVFVYRLDNVIYFLI